MVHAGISLADVRAGTARITAVAGPQSNPAAVSTAGGDLGQQVLRVTPSWLLSGRGPLQELLVLRSRDDGGPDSLANDLAPVLSKASDPRPGQDDPN